MGVWAVLGSDDFIDSIGEKIASFKEVSHCYKRPTYQSWKYNIFTMIHAGELQDAQKLMGAISKEIGIEDYEMLVSTRELKRAKLRYFTPEFEEWENSKFGFSKVS
jgi:DNA-binding Lrp family transcriptional regulator